MAAWDVKSLREQGPGVGARERWEPDRILGLVKENSTLPAAQGVARSVRKVKAWPGTVVTKDLVWDRWARGHSGL